MSGPFAGYFPQETKSTPTQTVQSKDPFAGYFDKPKEDATVSSQGFVDYLKNVSYNWVTQGAKRTVVNAIGLLDHLSASKILQDPSVKLAASDLLHTFDHVLDYGNPIQAATNIGLGMASSENGVSAKGLAIGAIKPLTDIMELSSGLQLTEDDTRALTPEEKASRIKNTVGLIAASAIAGPLSTALGGAPIGGLGQRMLFNAGVGAGAGAVYGGVSGANDRDQLGQIISGAIVGGSLGSLHGLFGGKGTPKASEVAQYRQLEPESNSMGSTIKLAQALATNDDLASALVEGKIGLKPGDIHIVPGVDPSKLSLVAGKIPKGYRSVLHVDKDGIGSLLVYDENIKQTFHNEIGNRTVIEIFDDPIISIKDKQRILGNDVYAAYKQIADNGSTLDTDILRRQKPIIESELLKKYPHLDEVKASIDEQFYQRTGFLLDQQVSYLGQDHWKVYNVQDDLVSLQNLNDQGSIVRAHPSDVRMLSNVILDRAKATDQMYEEWKATMQEQSPIKPQEPGIIDESKPQSILDQVPDLYNIDLKKNLNKFLSGKGFQGDDLTSLKREMFVKLSEESGKNYLEPAEQKIIKEAKSIPIQNQTDQIKLWKNFSRFAKSNGFDVTDGGSGRVIVREIDKNGSGKILGGFDNKQQAAKWINKSGQKTGINLDDNGFLDTGVGRGGMPPLPPEDEIAFANDEIHNFINNRANKGESIISFLNNVSWMTGYRDIMQKIDTEFGTKLSLIHDKIGQTQNIRNAKMLPYADETSRLIKFIKKVAPERREVMGVYSETMTPTERIANGYSRPLTPFEIKSATDIANSGVDLEKVFKFRADLRDNLSREFPLSERQSNPEIEKAYQERLFESKQAYAIDPAHQKVVDLFDIIETMNKDDATIGTITDLVDSIKNNHLSKSKFAIENKMTFEELTAINRLAAMYQKAGVLFGINPKSMINSFMSHARLFNGDIGEALNNFSHDVKTKNFYSSLSRTGELSAFEKDPIRAWQRYMKAGFDKHSGFSDAIGEGKNQVREELNKILDTGTRDNVKDIMNAYFNDVQGFPSASTKAFQESVTRIVDKFGLQVNKVLEKTGIDKQIKPEINVSDWTNAFTSLQAAGGVGGRLMLGLGHFGTSTVMSIVERNHSYTARVIAAGGKALSETGHVTIQELREKGVMGGLSPIGTMSDAEYAGTIRGKGRAFRDALFKFSGLPTIYDGMAAGHYITSNADALSALTKFGRKEITWDQVKKETFLDRYSASDMEHFTDLVSNNQHVEAADFLGRQAIKDIIGTYGSGNHPKGWGSNTGKLMGQFGTFSMFVRGSISRTLSRGTTAQRINSFAKLMGYSAALGVIGDEIGIDLGRMSPFHVMKWMLGPAFHTAQDLNSAFFGQGYEQVSAQRRLMRMSPIGNKDGEVTFHPSLLVPGSFAASDIYNAVNEFSNGDINFGQSILEGIGFPKAEGTPTLDAFSSFSEGNILQGIGQYTGINRKSPKPRGL